MHKNCRKCVFYDENAMFIIHLYIKTVFYAYSCMYIVDIVNFLLER